MPRGGDAPVTETDRLRALPKPELHVHLDGSLRPTTMIEVAAERGITLPATDPAQLERYMVAEEAGSLERYLTAFDLTVSVMQDPEAIERISYELWEDQALEGIRYAEVRFCPLLNTRRGLSTDDVLDAALRGLRRAEKDHGIRGALIVSALRHMDPKHSVGLVELASAYLDDGVCGFDLAGAEAGHPVRVHQEAFELAHSRGVPITIHAGEAFGPESIRQALDLGGAMRIGHGTRLGEDPDLLARIRDARVTLEICLTSNVQTGAATSYAEHPLRRYFDSGVSVTLCTDNRLVSGVSLTDEYQRARAHQAFTLEELIVLARNGFAHAFAPPDVRASLVGHFDDFAPKLLADGT